MSVLIRGMKMPKMPKTYSQGEVVPYIDIRIFADDKAVISKGEKPYFTEYCVIEVPPHGPLVDADALKATFCAECNHTITCEDCDIDYHIGRLAPTIIEAEEE